VLKPRNVLDDLTTLAVCREPDEESSSSRQTNVDAGAPALGPASADGGFTTLSNALAQPFAPVGEWGSFATAVFTPIAVSPPTEPVEAAPLAATVASHGLFKQATSVVATNSGAGDAHAVPSWGQASAAMDAPAQTSATEFAEPDKPKSGIGSTQPQKIDFTSSPLGVFGADTSFTFALPSFLYQHYGFSVGASFAGFGLQMGASITGGVKGSVALSLGEYTPNYPVTIDPGVAPFVQDGLTFSIDPSLISTKDASFSLSLPEANASLDFGLEATANAALSFPSVRIGVTLPIVGFVGYTVNIPSLSLGFDAGKIYKLPSNTTINIPGDGKVTLSELQAKTVQSAAESAYGGLPVLEASGDTAPFLVADTDLVGILAHYVPDPFSLLQGSESYDGLAGIDYKLLSLPLSGALWLNEAVTLVPIGITETVTDPLLPGQPQTGPLGSTFNFPAPASGSGTLPLSITFGLELAVKTTLELDGDIKLTVEGPSVSASVLGISGGVGPLGNFNLLDISGELFQLYNKISYETITATTTVNVQYSDSVTTETISSASGAVKLNTPGTDLLVTASGTVAGGAFGVQTGTLSAALVTDYGLITASGSGIALQEGGTVKIMGGGRITGKGASAATGILVASTAYGAVINAGSITGFAHGVSLGGGSLNNETGALISATGVNPVGVSIANTDASIINNGTIQGYQGVYLKDGGSLYNGASGVISGGGAFPQYGFGIVAPQAVSVENRGVIHGQISVTGSIAGIVNRYGNSTVTNLGGGYIQGGVQLGLFNGAGFTGGNELVTNEAGGKIAGANGVFLAGVNDTGGELRNYCQQLRGGNRFADAGLGQQHSCARPEFAIGFRRGGRRGDVFAQQHHRPARRIGRGGHAVEFLLRGPVPLRKGNG
jgi:hypothetical protein